MGSKKQHVVGLPGSGDPSPVTAFGTYMGMKACSKLRYGSDSLDGKKILVQGVGHVGEYLVDYLSKKVLRYLFLTFMRIQFREYHRVMVQHDLNDVYDVAMDIYTLALGGTNDDTISDSNVESLQVQR